MVDAMVMSMVRDGIKLNGQHQEHGKKININMHLMMTQLEDQVAGQLDGHI